MTASPITCTTIIPYKDCPTLLVDCLTSLLTNIPAWAELIVVDDGSIPAATETPALTSVLTDPRVRVLRHRTNRGPGAARNTGIRWCQANGRQIAILLDSDCRVEEGFFEKHRDHHERFREAVCLGGAIQGSGTGPWAKLDGIMSWFTSLPNAPQRTANHIYHIPTTNMSLKLARLPHPENPFDEELKTGEDVAFVKELLASRVQVLFHPLPVITHADRTNFLDFLRHQYRWGLHTYVVRFGRQGKKTWQRYLLASLVFLGLPAYGLLLSILNIRPWLQHSLLNLVWLPAIFPIYLIKGIGVVVGTIAPHKALFKHSPSHPRPDRNG